MNIPKNYQLCFDTEVIRTTVQMLAEKLSVWTQDVHHQTGMDVLAVPVLRGGIFFFSDLVRQIRGSVEVAPARARAYHVATNALRVDGKVDIHLDKTEVRDRSVLLIDEICESGKSLQALIHHIRGLGALEVRSAVLIRRKVENSVCNPDWIGFEYPGAEWFVGYGMDDMNRWSNLPEIYIIQKELTSVR